MKIAVIGGGPAGLTAAYKLSEELGTGIQQLDVYEAGAEVGGMARSIKVFNQTVDLGPHRFFSKDPHVNQLWLDVIGEEYVIVKRQTRIYYKNRFFKYPIQALNALKGLGFIEASRCVLSYIAQKIIPIKDKSSFEGWVTRRFGKRLYRIFFKSYSEKLWGIPTSELDSDFAAQRIKKLSLLEALKNSLSGRGGNKHATLVDRFAYPEQGSGALYEKMKRRIEERGGKVYLETAVKRVITEGGKCTGIELERGRIIAYDHIISSMPLNLLLKSMAELPDKLRKSSEALRFRNTILIYMEIRNKKVFPDQWIYIHDEKLKAGRITNFRNWSPALYGDSENSILCMEYWSSFGDELWEEEDDPLIEQAREDLVKSGLVNRDEILNSKVHRIPRCYPVYFKNYQEILLEIKSFLNTYPNLHVIGRYGAYKYNNQDHSILMGMRAAEKIINGKELSLWEINTDYEVYQEAAIITETGLSPLKHN